MEQKDNASLTTLEQALTIAATDVQAKEWISEFALPFKRLMAYYRCAIMEVETKFKVLNENFSIGNDCNHIESIKTRLKSPQSIIEKMVRCKFPLTVESIESNMHDIAGVRVICSFVSDIYMLADALLKQDDVILVEKKDYIAQPKPNGYRSLHLIIETPIFLENEKRMMCVEVQLRTLAMDTWASLEHKMRYKKDVEITSQISDELYQCSAVCAELDKRMELLNRKIGG
uniref:RelA/SpoT domain-containing protein n=1 Tax=uncultured bacterium pUR16A2 TaxID=1204710 RepID=R9QZM5_9BACT|nr:hypothetical protein [uncultured bacterium pUR16A2]